jgi:hypothetical protein
MDIKYARHKVFATQRAPFSKVVGRTSNGNSHARGASIAPPVRVTRPPEVRVHAIRPYRTLAYPGRATVSVACCVRHASFAMRSTFGDRPAFTSPRRDKHGRPPDVRVRAMETTPNARLPGEGDRVGRLLREACVICDAYHFWRPARLHFATARQARSPSRGASSP